MDSAEFLKALLDVSPLSLSETARRAELSKGGLSVFARGKGYLGDIALERVLAVLGVQNGSLDPSRVHYWIVGADVEPLKQVCEMLFLGGGEIAGLWREGREGLDLRRAVDPGLWALYGSHARVVLKRKALAGSMPHAGLIGPENLPNFKWRGGKVGPRQMVSIPSPDFDQWSAGDVAPQQFDQLLLGTGKPTWEDVMQYARAQKWNPSYVLNLFEQARSASTKKKW